MSQKQATTRLVQREPQRGGTGSIAALVLKGVSTVSHEQERDESHS